KGPEVSFASITTRGLIIATIVLVRLLWTSDIIKKSIGELCWRFVVLVGHSLDDHQNNTCWEAWTTGHSAGYQVVAVIQKEMKTYLEPRHGMKIFCLLSLLPIFAGFSMLHYLGTMHW